MPATTLKSQTEQGEPLEATFLPEMGMNMVSFKKGNIEIIDQSTRDQFEERFAGLGPLIGPHFHRRKAETIPPIKDENLFPHIAKIKAKGIQDPFSHGIGRYAPWNAQASNNKITASLSGKDTWNGIPLSELEGQNFKMTFEAELHPTGLHLNLTVVSDSDSLIGIHYYYALPDGKGKISAEIQNKLIDKNETMPIPSTWDFYSENRLYFDLNREADFTFYPHPDPLNGKITLETSTYRLQTEYKCICQENAWQLYHPAGASFVCIEPVSSQDPRHPNLTASSLQIHLKILDR
jgi:hypothetical protein